MTVQNEELLVVVDGECVFCRRAVAWIRPKIATPIRFIAFQTTDLKHYLLTREECEQRVHFIRGEYRSTGAIAVADLLQETHTPYALVAHLVRALAPLSQRVYDYLAAHRAGPLARLIAMQFPKIPDPLDTVEN